MSLISINIPNGSTFVHCNITLACAGPLAYWRGGSVSVIRQTAPPRAAFSRGGVER